MVSSKSCLKKINSEDSREEFFSSALHIAPGRWKRHWTFIFYPLRERAPFPWRQERVHPWRRLHTSQGKRVRKECGTGIPAGI